MTIDGRNRDDTDPVEGDDDGAEGPAERRGSLLDDAVTNGLNPNPVEDGTTDSGYSEEGRP